MKLHLPLSLRSALLAVLFYSSVSYCAEEILTGELTIEGEGNSYYYQDCDNFHITISEGAGLKIEGAAKWTGESSITVKSGGRFSVKDAYIAYTEKGSTSKITINVESNAVFEEHTAYIAYAKGENSQAEAIINVAGEFNMVNSIDGAIAYASSYRTNATTTITVNQGGTFNFNGRLDISRPLKIAYADMNGSNAVATINVAGTFNMGTNEDVLDPAIVLGYAKNRGSASINVDVTGEFNMGGGTIAYVNGEGTSTASIVVEEKGRFNYTGGSFGQGVSFTIKDSGDFDMNNNIVSRDILMQGGQLSNASKYNGTITITSAEGFTGNIQLGGASAATIQQLQTGAGVTVGGMTGALTIHEGDFMYVGAGSIGVVDGDGAGAPMLSFSESGSISFGNNSITLYFDEDAFDDMVRDDSGKASFEIYFTDGKLGANDIGKFEFGEEYSDFVITGIQDGKLMVNGTLPEITPAGIWFASEHVDDKSGLLTESGKMPGLKYSQVVVNRNAHLTISKATQLNELQGDSLLDLLGGGDVTLNIESEETLYSGTISTVAGVSLEKVGEGILEVSGKLDAAGAVKVSEGWLYLSGEAHNIGSLSMNDGYLQLGDKTQLNLTGASTQSGGTITGGSIVLDGSSAGYEMTGGSISGTSISLSDGATFTQKDGQVSSTTITIDGAGSVYKLGWLSESIEDNHTSSLAGNKEIKITNGGKFVQDGHSSIFTSNDSAVSITIDGEGSEYVMESTNGGGANMGAWGGSVEIEIKNGGKFTQGDSNCWVAHAISSPEKNSTIKISGEGSEYEMKDGRLGGGIGIGSVEIGISEGGKFTQKDGDIDGKETSITITGEKKSATFEQSGGTLTAGGGISVSGAQASFVQSGGKITGTDITLSKGASFTQSKGSIESSGKITLNDSGSFTQSGGSVGKGVSIELNDSSSLTLASGGSMAADVVLKGAKSSYDLGHQAASGSSITMNGGSLKNAGSYKGSVSIDIKSGYKGGDIKLGGVDASTITSVKIKEGGVSLSELKAGTTLTLTGSDNLLTVGSGNTDLDGTSGTALIQFVDGDGYICFNKDGSITLVLDLTGAILKNLESQENFTIHLSNGKITDWTEENFVFSGLLEELGFYVEKVENGDLIVRSGELGDNLFRASEVDGRLDDVDKQESLKDKDAVVMDEDLTIEVGEGFDDDELTLNNVVTWVDDESKTDLDITNKSGEDLDVNLHNDFNTTLDGNLTAKSEGEDNQTNLKKTGEGNLTVTGNVRTDGDLDVQEGGLGVGGDADIGGGVTVGDSENDTEGKLVVEGDLTTGGDLDIENGEVGVDGKADIGGGVTVGDSENDTEGKLVVEGDLTTDGDLDIENGEVGVGGKADIGGGVTVGDSENDTEGKLVVEGDLTTDGDLDIENGEVGVGGKADIGGGVTVGDSENDTEGKLVVGGDLTTDGDLDIENGEVGVGGKADIGGGVTVGDSENDTEGKLVVEGDLTTGGDLDIENGDVGVGGKADIGGGVTVGDSENDTEGKLVVGGDLTTDGDLDIENGEVGVGGKADIGGGVTVGDSENDTEGKLVVEGDLTTDGDLDIENGEVGVDGDADIGGSVTVGDSENDTEGSLVVGGDLDISGDLDIENGDVSLGGDDNHIGGSVTVGDAENGTSGSLEADGNLDIDGDLNIENGDVKMEGDNNRVGGDLHLGNEENGTEGNLEIDGSLTVEGDVDLSQGSGSITGDGELHIGEDGSLKMGDNVDLDGPSLTVDGELDMSGVKDPTLGGLGGDGRVNAGEDADITIEGTGGDFSGTLEGSGRISVTGDGTNQSFTDVLAPDFDLAVKNGGHLSLTESTFGSVEAKKDGQLEFRAKGTGPADNGGANVILTGDLIFRNGSTTTLSFNMNADKLWDAQEARMVSVDGTIYIEREAQFVLSSVQTGKEMPAGRKGDLTNILVMESGSISVADEFPEEMSAGIDTQNSRAANSESLKVKLGGLFGLFYENPTLTVQDNEVRMSATYRENAPGNNAGGDTGFLEETTKESGGGSTSQAGAGLLDHADLESDSTLSEVGNALGNMLASGNHAGAAGTMAAVAGSTVTSLGAAQRDATRGELQRLRRLAGVRLPQVSGESLPMHMWIEGNGDFRRLSSEGDLSGYRLNSWGGTVGAAVAPGKDVLLGLSLSAQYGDLEASAADSAKGDLDGYYLSLFAHVRERAWGHSFSATLGKHEASLNRVVDFGEGSYATQGSTSGRAYGLAYELTYDMPLAEGGRSILQPLVSVSLVSTSMDGYAEQGAGGAGLSVGRQKWTTSSVAVGARWLAQLSDSVFGRGAHTELHVALAQDMGDSQGSASVALQANPGYSRQVQGAEIGRTSLQLGAGLALPVSESKQLYIYTHADLRSGSTSWNLGSGLRMAF